MIRADQIRNVALIFWSLGLTAIAIDFFSFPILQWQASLSYIPFSISFLLLIWAEKREFSTRVFLYRLHDILIFSSWRYFLLFFLWISIFSPFSPDPVASILYSTNGWLSFFVVGVSAQFLFLEHRPESIYLLPNRLSFAFRVYAISLCILFLHVLLTMTIDSNFPVFVSKKENLLLYFVMGFPFLLWDFSKSGRKLIPPYLSFVSLLLGVVTTLLLGRKFFSLVLICSVAGVFSLYVYKKAKSRPYILGSIVLTAGIFLTAIMGAFLKSDEIRAWTLQKVRSELEMNLSSRILPTWSALVDSGFLGKGVANSNVSGMWFKILSETGVVGTILVGCFFLSLLWRLFSVRKSNRVVVSNISLVSVIVFLGLISIYVENPYGAYVWVWFGIWAVFAATEKKRGFQL